MTENKTKMPEAKLGKGLGSRDTINVSNITHCEVNCRFQGAGDGRFRCIQHNSSSTIEVFGGVHGDTTLAEFKNAAPCLNAPPAPQKEIIGTPLFGNPHR
jgi:hypothetical protein